MFVMHRVRNTLVKEEGLGVDRKVVILLIEVVGDFALVGPGDGGGRKESPGRGRMTESA